jgi:hypothetical protein
MTKARMGIDAFGIFFSSQVYDNLWTLLENQSHMTTERWKNRELVHTYFSFAFQQCDKNILVMFVDMTPVTDSLA